MKHADARTRIHIFPERDRTAWSFGPTGARFHTPTTGAAIEEALDRLGHQPAVIIYEGRAK
jgi:hypothetical protein